jgi:hypothetical protein
MPQFFANFFDFVRQGIGAIGRFIQAVWWWAADQTGQLLQLPWKPWPHWKLLVLGVVAYFVLRQVYYAFWEIWQAWGKILAALATLMGVLIKTVPQILIAVVIALGGIWLLSVIDLSRARLPSFLPGPSEEVRDSDGDDDRFGPGRCPPSATPRRAPADAPCG